jgi:hypothetical protein
MDKVLSSAPIHEERQSFTLMYIIAVFAAAVIVTAAWSLNASAGRTDPTAMATLAFAAVMAGIAIWGFSRLTVTITPTELRFGYPVWHRRAPVTQLIVGDIVPIPFWYGIGLHFVRGMWVYNAHLGRGVVLWLGNNKYLIGSDHPERLQSALLQVAPRREKV